ncbi:MAG: hypothetical protein KTR31_20355 [Myxococcales bacterium]|nr:hypothetical protein [Myxococcales bacterium]
MTARSVIVPGANSPQLLTRILEAVAQGVRTTRGLQRSCGVQGQTVRSYLQAGEWLGLLETTDPIVLSPLGLEFVYAGARRAQLYVRAVWSNAFAADLLVAGDGRLPDLTHIERAILALEPDLAAATVRRRASAVRSLVAPAVGRPRPRPREQEELQLALPLGHAASAASPPSTRLDEAISHDPDAYRLAYAHLLDHGELSLRQIRGLLQRAGAPGIALGELVDMALRRGDARRHGDHLVVTGGGLARRDLADTTLSILLSDPDYRRFLSSGDHPDPRIRTWDERLFGGPVRQESRHQHLSALLMDRSLDLFPEAGDAEQVPPTVTQRFLDVWEHPGLPISFPPTLSQLQGGVAAINRLLASEASPDASGERSIVSPCVAVHGGLLFPSEAAPRSIPDLRTLRQRLLLRAPGPALLAALLLLHRQQPDRISLLSARGGWGVQVGLESPTPLMTFLERLAQRRRWMLVRRTAGGIDANAMVRVGEALGVVTVVGRRAVLAEDLAVRLSLDPQEMEIRQRLQSLTDALAASLDAEPGPGPELLDPQLRYGPSTPVGAPQRHTVRPTGRPQDAFEVL